MSAKPENEKKITTRPRRWSCKTLDPSAVIGKNDPRPIASSIHGSPASNVWWDTALASSGHAGLLKKKTKAINQRKNNQAFSTKTFEESFHLKLFDSYSSNLRKTQGWQKCHPNLKTCLPPARKKPSPKVFVNGVTSITDWLVIWLPNVTKSSKRDHGKSPFFVWNPRAKWGWIVENRIRQLLANCLRIPWRIHPAKVERIFNFSIKWMKRLPFHTKGRKFTSQKLGRQCLSTYSRMSP